MKFLHTGDWHLGKTLYDVSLIEDQKHFINQVLEIFSEAEKTEEPYDALIIPGDIYDRSVPSVAAVKLFNSFLNEMNDRFPNIHIFILAGNHDGPDRMSFASEFLEKSNIHICTAAQKIPQAVVINGVAVYQIPFLIPGCFGDELKEQNELYKRATEMIAESHEKNHHGIPLVVCAHATVFGAENPELSVGTAASIDKSLFDGFTYTALGHIHKFQRLSRDDKMFYSGSPIAYTFDDDAEKFFLSVKIGSDATKPERTEKIPVDVLHPLVRLKGKFEDFRSSSDYEKYKNCYIEIKSTDANTVQNAKQLLREKYPHLLSFVRDKILSMEENANFAERKRILKENKQKAEIELLKKFLEEIYIEEKDGKKVLAENAKIPEKLKLFEELFSDETIQE
ncbi:MAG: exonuclease SbcCD subunit D [Treponema sp.]|nr:exonuclease SbcCD subunit D [Treponema sp.]